MTVFVLIFFNLTAVTPLGFSVPIISETTLSQITLILGWENNFFCNNFSALNSPFLWISVTFFAKFVRNKDSSTAEFPPPTTTTSLFLKKKPSQVAQAETPNPLYFSSDSKFNHLACAPVEIITLSAK